jgi:hypothetical protein
MGWRDLLGRRVVLICISVLWLIDVALAVTMGARPIIVSAGRITTLRCLVQTRAFADGANTSSAPWFLLIIRHDI